MVNIGRDFLEGFFVVIWILINVDSVFLLENNG